jgi:hypothetical protein
MAAGNWILYDTAREAIGDGSSDLDNNTFRIILCSDAGNPQLSTLSYYSDITTELATANGYTAGGEALATVAWTRSGFTVTFDSDNKTWTAAGGNIGAQYAAIYDFTSTNSLLMCSALLDTTPSLVTATDGNTFTVAMNAGGIFTLSGATA